MRTDGPEHQGDRGGLFLHTVRLMQEVFDRLGRRRRGFLYENVVMSRPAADAVSEALDTQPRRRLRLDHETTSLVAVRPVADRPDQ